MQIVSFTLSLSLPAHSIHTQLDTSNQYNTKSFQYADGDFIQMFSFQ